MPLGGTVDGGARNVAGPRARDTIVTMSNLMKLIKDESGATALEYGLMAAAVAGVLIVVAYFLGGKVSSTLNNVGQHLG